MITKNDAEITTWESPSVWVLLLPRAGPNWKLDSPRCLRLTQHCAMMYRVGRSVCQHTTALEYSRNIAAWDCLGGGTANYQGGGGTKTGPLQQAAPDLYRSPPEHPELNINIPHVVKCNHTFALIATRRLLQVFPAVIPCHGNNSHLSPPVFPPLFNPHRHTRSLHTTRSNWPSSSLRNKVRSEVSRVLAQVLFRTKMR